MLLLPEKSLLRSLLSEIFLYYTASFLWEMSKAVESFFSYKKTDALSSASAVLFASKINISAYEQLQTSSYALLKAFRNVLFSEPQQSRRP